MDLNVFDFDYDLVWAGLFLSPDEQVYGRYGSRNAASADDQLSLAGLRYAMSRALDAHRRQPRNGMTRSASPPRTVEQYPAARRLRATACIHCHQAYDFRREELQAAGRWRKDEVWVYPEPENLGLTLDVDQGDRVKAVVAESVAAKAGLQPGDVLRTVKGMSVASVADARYGFHRAPASGVLPVTWVRAGKAHQAELPLAGDWRKTDLSWRASLKSVGPAPCVHGEDLTAEEKKALGLGAKALALRQGSYPSPAARQAGLRQNDIILGLDSKALDMTAGQFLTHIRLIYEVGDRVTFNVLRGGRRVDIPLVLPARAPY